MNSPWRVLAVRARPRYGEPSAALCAMGGDHPPMTHVLRSRQLPTNQHHASLHASGRVTREYQFDSPSRTASLLRPGLSRDGPERTAHDATTGLTGSSISVLWFISMAPYSPGEPNAARPSRRPNGPPLGERIRDRTYETLHLGCRSSQLILRFAPSLVSLASAVETAPRPQKRQSHAKKVMLRPVF